jgi:hypothetical protein
MAIREEEMEGEGDEGMREGNEGGRGEGGRVMREEALLWNTIP